MVADLLPARDGPGPVEINRRVAGGLAAACLKDRRRR